MNTPMIDILLGDRDFTTPCVRVILWDGDNSTFANLDIKELAKEVGVLRAELAAARVVDDAMVERFMDGYTLADTEDSTHRIRIRAALTAALSEAP